LSASLAPDPGRHHVGTPGDIISECLGDFVGIRIKTEIKSFCPSSLDCPGRAVRICVGDLDARNEITIFFSDGEIPADWWMIATLTDACRGALTTRDAT
jgi:hypothetical protein